jgi:DNA-nicking Smr family endonuclease
MKEDLQGIELTFSLAQYLHDYLPTTTFEQVVQALIDADNDLSQACSRLNQLLQPPPQRREEVKTYSKQQSKFRIKLGKLYPKLTADEVDQVVQECGSDLTAVVCLVAPEHGIPERGKYRKVYNKLHQTYPDLESEVLLALLIDAKFNLKDVLSALMEDPIKQSKIKQRATRQVNKLASWFPKEDPEQIKALFEEAEFDFNKALSVLRERQSNSPEERSKALHKRLIELYANVEPDVLLEILCTAELDLLRALDICTEVFGAPGTTEVAVPIAEQDLRRCPAIAPVADTAVGFMSEQEFTHKQHEMEALKQHFTRLNIHAKDLRRTGAKAEAKVLAQEAKDAKARHNMIYKEIYEETFRRNNLRKEINQVDLHGLKPEEAMIVLERHLEVMQEMVREQRLREFKILVITGWGKHNANHRSVLKEMTAQLLSRKRMRFYEHNKGSYEVILTS